MPFIQEQKTNIKRCNGCGEQCKLDAHPQIINGTNCVRFLPKIAEKIITEYIDKNDCRVHAPLKLYKEEAINLARQIAHLCDNYRNFQK